MALRTLAMLLVLATTLQAAPQDDRTADREAIRAHIDSIFQAFINKDAAKLRATHHQNWLGYLEGSRTMIRGVGGYMDNVYVDPASAYGMKSYKMREFDMIFKGDAAFVCRDSASEGRAGGEIKQRGSKSIGTAESVRDCQRARGAARRVCGENRSAEG
ncbi:MAG: hypothetical protein AABN34_27095 [Acidobacteriota bacterium]